MDAFEAIFVLLIYGLALLPNVDNFDDVNAIRIFLIGNVVPNLFGDTHFSPYLRNSKGGGIVVCCIALLYKWFISHLPCGEFSNVPLIGTQGGINYNPTLARRQLRFPLKDKPNNVQLEGMFYQEGKNPQNLKSIMVHAWHNVHRKGRVELGLYNCVALEPYTSWVKNKALELKMLYACERPMFMVVVKPSTLPNQDIEELEDTLAKMKQERD
ncbi:hypothetical protein KIW84_012804 [Lathyrus oleraceus]|uniref:DUF7745 domain-containing protein n=1 Tax=Pisum sativum TaxID=3888 RepID=A0A9D5BIT0_PEA|nr:hypothetical protein KIW84_012804 [Pisum sativum]